MKSMTALHRSAPDAFDSLSEDSYDRNSRMFDNAYSVSSELRQLASPTGRCGELRYYILGLSGLPVGDTIVALKHTLNGRFFLRMVCFFKQNDSPTQVGSATNGRSATGHYN
jgi:hypothetical protein